MRALSLILAVFILASGFVLAGFSVAGTADGSVPGAGTFAYRGAPLAAKAPQPIMMASRI